MENFKQKAKVVAGNVGLVFSAIGLLKSLCPECKQKMDREIYLAKIKSRNSNEKVSEAVIKAQKQMCEACKKKWNSIT